MDFGLSLGIPGMPSIPSLTLASDARSGINSNGAAFSASGGGAWTVNLAGSGTAVQAAAGGGSGGGVNWLLIAAIAGAVWYLKK